MSTGGREGCPDTELVESTATTITKSLLSGTSLTWSYCRKMGRLTKTESVCMCDFMFSFFKVLFQFLLSFCIAAIRQAISKSLVAYYQKCKCNVLL